MRPELRIDVAQPVGGVECPGVLLRVVDALAGVLEIEDLVAERAQAEQIHQRAPGDATQRVARDDAGKKDSHNASCVSSSIVNGSSSERPTTSRCHMRR